MTIKLYELQEAYQNILDLDLTEEELKDALLALKGSIKEKANSIGQVLNTFAAEAAVYDAEIKRLKAKKDAAENKADRLKDYLSYTLKTMEIDKLECDLFKFSFKGSKSLIVDDEKLIPEEFVTKQEVIKVDKKALKKAIDANGEIPGCHIHEKKNLQIR